MKCFAILALFFILLGVPQSADGLSEQDLLYPTTGHWGEVRSVVHAPNQDRVVTAGEDGSIRVWSTVRPSLLRVHSVSPRALSHLTLHPSLPHAAVIENSGSSRPVLSVWNWDTGRKVFRTELQTEPLSMAYSPNGSFLVFTIESLNSVVIVSPETGEVLDHGVQRTGIASYFTVSGSETTLMAYTPGNGRFTYYNIEDGRVLQTVNSESHLENLTILPNRRLSVAQRGSDLLLVDILRGGVLDRVGIPSIRSIAVNERNSDIAVVHQQNGRYYYRTWYIHENRLQEREQLLRELNRPPVLVAFFDGKSLVASKDGTLSYYFAQSRYPRILSSDRRLPVNGIAYSGGQLYLQADDTFLQFSGLVSASTTDLGLSLRSLSESFLSFPPEGEYTVHGALLGKLWFRRTDLPKPHLYQLRTEQDSTISASLYDFDSAIVGHQVAMDRILIETEAGQVLLWDPALGMVEYTHSASEISAYAYHPVHGLSIGTNSAAGSGRTLVHIDPSTGETVPLATPAFITTDIVFSDETGSLYALGLEQSTSGMLYTRLDRWSGPGFSVHENLYRTLGADWSARLAAVPGTDTIWALPATGRIQVWNHSGKLAVDSGDEFYVDLGVYGDLVYTIHRSGAVSFYSASKAEKLLTLYLFRDRAWAAITPNQQFLLSAGAVPEDYLVLVSERTQPDAQYPATLTRFRLPLPALPASHEP